MVIIFSGILIVCQILIFLCPLLYQTSPRTDFMPFIALSVLWLNRLLYHGRNSIFSVILWILFAIIGLIGLLSAIFTVFSYGDMEKKVAPMIFGKADSSKIIAMVYHPGGSNLPKSINIQIAEKLAQNGFKVILYTANAHLKINVHEISAIGFSSPVYGSEIRPPLTHFIQRTDLTGIKCFVALSGWADSPEAVKVQKIIESKGGIYIGGKKLTSSDLKQTKKIDAFVESIKDKF